MSTRLLINGREVRNPAARVFATMLALLLIGVVLIVLIPLIGVVVAVAIAGGALMLGGIAAMRLFRGRNDEPASPPLPPDERYGDRPIIDVKHRDLE